jgi:exopolyphosphatase/guanosine-5'-triphosphate,3'-diphosphate pyrophosphatase
LEPGLLRVAGGELVNGAEQGIDPWFASLAERYENELPLPDRAHALRCATFAGTLFDALAEALMLAEDDRQIVVAAVLWHDVGYARDARDHARKSFDMIAGANVPEFTHAQTMIIASVARYHRRLLPSIEHVGFGEMTAGDQRRVRRLSAICRVAVALDASHLGLVDNIQLDVRPDYCSLTAWVTENAEFERDRLAEAASAFGRLTSLRLVYDIVVAKRPTLN